ncbi:TetR/AcrR family transcriptional regulator [Phaeacidiphilus oryzae]|uniref:TetR/AcrR family transcriptional regulator n=1 Tax=Phaeacidiphilus oryzae TaxID=348818 RepID=UPI000567FB7C|nr:TetR/AcrR family transcriptional regulator [Phaeacidiphilus oryzae]
MPTGTALRDPRTQLFAAAERILLDSGPNALTSRAVTTEAGCAKGVLHRHFADFDDFLAALVRDRIGWLEARGRTLSGRIGLGGIAENLADTLDEVFTPLVAAEVGLVIARDGLRARLRELVPRGLPLLAEATRIVRHYLAAEQETGRLAPEADPAVLAPTLIGAAHLLYADRESPRPDAAALRRTVDAVLAGAGAAATPSS